MPNLSFDQYQTRARSTAFYPHVMEDGGGHPIALAYCLLGLNGEAGESAEVLKKTWRNEGEALQMPLSDQLKLLVELGGTLWYCSMLASELKVSLESVAQFNLFVLAKRAELGPAGWDEETKEQLLVEYWQEGNALVKPSPLTKPHDCEFDDDQSNETILVPVDHPANAVDWEGARGSQSYQVYRCKVCGDYWGIRHQYDPGTGQDDRIHRFGNVDPETIKRHY